MVMFLALTGKGKVIWSWASSKRSVTVMDTWQSPSDVTVQYRSTLEAEVSAEAGIQRTPVSKTHTVRSVSKRLKQIPPIPIQAFSFKHFTTQWDKKQDNLPIWTEWMEKS